jgi:hypothetical protein
MIYDIDNNPLPSYLMNLAASGVFQFSIRVNCRTGLYLRSQSVSDLLVEGRKQGDISWINLETTGIDLSADNETRQTFEVRLTASAVTARAIKNFKLYTQ